MNPNPNFCVGELVNTAFDNKPNRTFVEITRSTYHKNISAFSPSTMERFRYTGWSYMLEDSVEWVSESRLRKIPRDIAAMHMRYRKRVEEPA